MEALRKYKYSLEHKIALLGEEDPSVGWSKNNIGNAFKGLGKYDEALKWYQEALTTVTKHYGPEHPEVGHVHWNMGLCYQSKGEGDAYKRKVQEEECGWVGGTRTRGRVRKSVGPPHSCSCTRGACSCTRSPRVQEQGESVGGLGPGWDDKLQAHESRHSYLRPQLGVVLPQRLCSLF